MFTFFKMSRRLPVAISLSNMNMASLPSISPECIPAWIKIVGLVLLAICLASKKPCSLAINIFIARLLLL